MRRRGILIILQSLALVASVEASAKRGKTAEQRRYWKKSAVNNRANAKKQAELRDQSRAAKDLQRQVESGSPNNGDRMNKTVSRALAPVLAFAAVTSAPEAGAARWRGARSNTSTNKSLVNDFIENTLKVEDTERFDLTRRLRLALKRGMGTLGENDKPSNSLGAASLTEAEREALVKRFSSQSLPNIIKFARALSRPAYNNFMLLGEPGVGKTFTLDQLIILFSFGVYNDEIGTALGLDKSDMSPFEKHFLEQFIGNTQFVRIDNDFLSRDSTPQGSAWPNDDTRKRALIVELFKRARLDFLKNKRRTVVILEEAATLPGLVKETLKSVLDETGFKDPTDPLAKGSETGFSVLGMTTPMEFAQMIEGDTAVQRRYEVGIVLEPSEEEAFNIMKSQVPDLSKRYDRQIGDEVLEHLIVMRKFFNMPPQAMPACVLNALSDIMRWSQEAGTLADPASKTITLADSDRFLIEKAQLPKAIWMPEDGTRPLSHLAEQIKTKVIGEPVVRPNGIVDQIVRKLRAGLITGFREVPTFIIIGPPGSGKNTIVNAINEFMFGHDGKHMAFSLAQKREKEFAAIIEGLPGARERPLLVKALESGKPHGVITLDEAGDLPSGEFDRLKTIIENGVITPQGVDSRQRPLGINALAILGQWGEEMLEGKSEEEAYNIVQSLTQDQLIDLLRKGKDGGRTGAIDEAVIQRAARTGGIYFMPPTPSKDYIHIANINLVPVLRNLEQKSKIELDLDVSARELIVALAQKSNQKTRAMLGVASDLVETLISEAAYRGMPSRHAKLRISAEFDPKQPYGAVLTITDLDENAKVKSEKFNLGEVLRMSPSQECEIAAIVSATH